MENIVLKDACRTVQDTNNGIASVFAKFPIQGKINGVGEISNCKFYGHYPDGTNPSTVAGTTACVACKKGYRGRMKLLTGTQFYIDECVAFSDCDSTKEIVHSIHSKNSLTNYPFKTLTTAAIYDLNVYFQGC